jgi:hypothetical protein
MTDHSVKPNPEVAALCADATEDILDFHLLPARVYAPLCSYLGSAIERCAEAIAAGKAAAGSVVFLPVHVGPAKGGGGLDYQALGLLMPPLSKDFKRQIRKRPPPAAAEFLASAPEHLFALADGEGAESEMFALSAGVVFEVLRQSQPKLRRRLGEIQADPEAAPLVTLSSSPIAAAAMAYALPHGGKVTAPDFSELMSSLGGKVH